MVIIKDIYEQIDKQIKTELQKQRLKDCINLLQLSYPAYVSRAEVMEWCHIGNDRDARRVVSEVKTMLPIIATSDRTGYKLAMVLERDIEEVIHTWKELDSRIEELEKAKKPLIQFYDHWQEAQAKGLEEENTQEAIWQQDYEDYLKEM